MTLEDKISLCTGGDFWHTKAMPQYDIPAIMMSDGPHGQRCQPAEADMIGVNDSLPATCFPTAVTAGATWDLELYAAEGEAIGKEGAAAGVPWYLALDATSSAILWVEETLNISRKIPTLQVKWLLLSSVVSRAQVYLPA